MAINQAMGTPRERDAGARYLNDFVEDAKASGFVAEAFARNQDRRRVARAVMPRRRALRPAMQPLVDVRAGASSRRTRRRR